MRIEGNQNLNSSSGVENKSQINQEKVDKLKNMISNNSFQIKPEAIAQKMIDKNVISTNIKQG